jgi:hypothetical protein
MEGTPFQIPNHETCLLNTHHCKARLSRLSLNSNGDMGKLFTRNTSLMVISTLLVKRVVVIMYHTKTKKPSHPWQALYQVFCTREGKTEGLLSVEYHVFKRGMLLVSVYAVFYSVLFFLIQWWRYLLINSKLHIRMPQLHLSHPSHRTHQFIVPTIQPNIKPVKLSNKQLQQHSHSLQNAHLQALDLSAGTAEPLVSLDG